MYTIETIKEMMNTSQSLQEFEEIKSILIDKRVEILESYDRMSERTQISLSDDSFDLNCFQPSIEETQILEEYAKATINHEKIYTSIQKLLNDVHLKIRGFYDSNI